MKGWDKLYDRAEALLSRLEGLLPAGQVDPDWNSAIAFRWRKFGRTDPFNL